VHLRTYLSTKPLGRVLAAAVIVGLLLTSPPAEAQQIELERVATGFSRPVFLTAAPGDDERVFVVEQHSGEVLILRRDGWTIDATPFVTAPGISTGSEQGLLGLAFHPDYESNGHFYISYTATDRSTQIVRYQVSANPDVANVASATPILSTAQPQANHNGGWIGFGPDGYLYIALGDGGGGDDNDSGHTPGTGNAQDITSNWLGKILAIDVDADDFPADVSRNYAIPPDNPFVGITGDDEIWAYGLRNPWRTSFDRVTGDLWIGDVGQVTCEEVNVQPFDSAGGENYGWRLREGTLATPTGGVGGPAPADAIDPILDYPHPGVSCTNPGPGVVGNTVTGGYVYRGPHPDLQGRYFFADFGTGVVWSLVWDGTDPAQNDGTNYSDFIDHSGDPGYGPDAGTLDLISSFGEDDDGNLYAMNLSSGEVFLVPEPSAALMQAAGLLVLSALARRARTRVR
jgi:glucose/arabinose dehydrogenase